MNDNFFNIEGKKLDKEQIESSIYIGNQLVVAGAGAGKTLSIVGKVKYLLEEKSVNPSEILVLAFTDKVVNELKERIEKVTSKKIDILTFHKLGLKIFNRSKEHKDIETQAFYHFLRDYMYDGGCIQDINLSSMIYHFIKREFIDSSLVASENIMKLIDNVGKQTLNGENVKSVVALIVCNMLFVNNIEYQYVITNKYSHYVKFDNKIISFTSKTSGDNLSLKGVDYINTPKILKQYLANHGYDVKSYRSYKDFLDEPGEVKRFEELFESLEEAQTVAATAGVYDDDFEYLIEHYCSNKADSIMFLRIFKEIRRKFCNWLTQNYQTDFNYMIDGPIAILKNNKFLKYKYIIVDEYQDISPARYNLLVELLKQNNGCLMAYGDDWQSIYAFSGSNNKFFMQFCDKLPDAKEFYLNNTYRNSQQLIDTSSRFVMLNPCQKKKNIHSNKRCSMPIKVLKYSVSNIDSLIYTLEYIKKIETDNIVNLMVLGRTNYSIDLLRNLEEFVFMGKDDNGKEKYYHSLYPNILIEFLTIHRSKGLEADYVFVTSVNECEMPLDVTNRSPYISIISKLNEYEEEKEHERYDGLPNSEERRLFYVALTRSKNIVFLSAPNLDGINYSPFIDDLVDGSCENLEFIEVGQYYKSSKCIICPNCHGMVKEVSKKGRKFYFCENKCSLSSKLELKPMNNCVTQITKPTIE